jgi:hypothetical protein
MKRILFVVSTIFFLGFSAMATESPIDKGSMVLGGSAYFQVQSGDLYEYGNKSQKYFTVNPIFGYFIGPGVMTGATFNYTRVTAGDYGSTLVGISPTVMFYFNSNSTEVKGAVYPYIGGFFYYQSTKSDGGSARETTSLGGAGGINYMLSEAVALDFGAHFQSDSRKSAKGTILTIGAGISYFIW